MITGLNHVGLFVKDIEKSKAFYTETLGFQITCDKVMDDGIKVCFVNLGDLTIEIVQFPEYSDKCDGYFDHIALMVDDIEATMSDLAKKGVAFETEEPVFMPVFDKGVRYIMFRGPDGEHLELNQIL